MATSSKKKELEHWEKSYSSLLTFRRQKGLIYLRVLLDYRGTRGVLVARGFISIIRAGSIYTAWIPLGELDHSFALPQLRYLVASRRLHSHLNVSAALIQAPQMRLRYGLDGRGVIVGVVDTGIDYEHLSFRNPDGTTRILAILDFSLPCPLTKEPPRVFTRKEIDEALRTGKALGHKDKLGHGTHITGIAAGNGSSKSDNVIRYQGIAPRADLVIVKGIREDKNDFDSGDVLQGISYIHKIAKLLKRPYVINLSLGGQHGGHDGGSLLERAIARFSGLGFPGQIVVASAGNEGTKDIHARGWLKPSHRLSLPLQIPAYPKDEKKTPPKARVLVEFWYPKSGDLTFSIESPSGLLIGPFSSKALPLSSQAHEDGVLSISHTIHSGQSASHQWSFLFSNGVNEALRSGTWYIQIHGKTSRFDAWIAESSLPSGSPRWLDYLSQDTLIGVPASSEAVITVGSFNSRSGWRNITNAVIERDIVVGDISSFSSPGPTRDNRPKPEVVAPGLFIAAPLSKDHDVSSGSTLAEASFFISQGTVRLLPM